MTLSTGHSSPAESLMISKAAKDAGVKRIFVQHPAMPFVDCQWRCTKEAVKMGPLLEYVLGEGIDNQKDLEQWTGLTSRSGRRTSSSVWTSASGAGPRRRRRRGHDAAHAEDRLYAGQHIDVAHSLHQRRSWRSRRRHQRYARTAQEGNR
jgi:hypothetical protein